MFMFLRVMSVYVCVYVCHVGVCVCLVSLTATRSSLIFISDMTQDARTNSSSVSSSPRPDPVKEL